MKKLLAFLTASVLTTCLWAQRLDSNNFVEACNFKTADPVGEGEAHYIPQNKDITYTIFFQNFGSDTVYNVRVEDTLSVHFDISSLREEAASNPFEMTLFNENIVRFSFPNIRLPNVKVNESESKGYIKFSISQKDNLPLMTKITNKASIYFDFNAPFMTNEVFHTIGQDLTNTEHRFMDGMAVQITPNPVKGQAQVSIAAPTFQEGELQVYNLSGQRLQNVGFVTNRFDFDASDLPKGVLFYKIELDGQLAASGSFISQ